MKFLIKKFLRYIAGIPQPTLDFPPYYENRTYAEGLSWSICKVLDDGFKLVDVLDKVEKGMEGNTGELSPFIRGAWNGLCLVWYGKRVRNIVPIRENRTTAPFRSKLPPSVATNSTNPEPTINHKP